MAKRIFQRPVSCNQRNTGNLRFHLTPLKMAVVREEMQLRMW